MKALIDLDPIVYQYAELKFPDETYMPARFASQLAMNKIESIVEGAGADSWVGYLTHGPDNFRIEVATIREYKGNRKNKERPRHYDYLRGWLSDHPNVHMVFGMEADDALSIYQYKELGKTDTIICTIDKDLEMVPGWHYRWSKGNVKEIEPWIQTRIGGLRSFYCQLLTGDSVDNIHGLYGVGPKSTYISRINEMVDEQDMAKLVLELYHKWYGNYAEQFMSENAKLLWMKRTIDDDWEIPRGITYVL